MLNLFEEGKNNLVVDLQEVRFVDSSGLGALVSGFKNASARNGNLKLSGLQPQVQVDVRVDPPAPGFRNFPHRPGGSGEFLKRRIFTFPAV